MLTSQVALAINFRANGYMLTTTCGKKMPCLPLHVQYELTIL